ncbi:MAG: hypothetical protein KH452_03870 [Clostridiales bacterium]|nr:hypothetical protein [Clostridiales bacterium]
MKNKSKLKKPAKVSVPKVPAEWLYLNPAKTELRRIYELFREDMPWKAELWEEAGVLEIELLEGGSVDMESMETDLGEEAGNAYLAEQGIQSVFAVTIMPEHYEKAREVMEKIAKEAGGFFCGDTEDLAPVIKAE